MTSILNSMNNSFDWESLTSFDELNKEIIKFLEGKHSNSPWHVGRINNETVPLLGDLIKLNRLGFISIDGQPAEVGRSKNGSRYIQHAYITGILDTRKYKLDKLINELEKDPSIFAAIYVFKTKSTYILNKPKYVQNGIYPLANDINDNSKSKKYSIAFSLNMFERASGEAFVGTESLIDEIVENCAYIKFINNIHSTVNNPDAGKGFERKLIHLLESISPSTRNNTTKNNYKGGLRIKKRYNKFKRTRKHKYNN